MPLDAAHLKESIAEAERFLKRAKVCLSDIYEESKRRGNVLDGYVWSDKTKSAAVRRASMDLTRALAQLRRY